MQEVDLIRDTLAPQGITVFPGFEISSTEKVHMVCLFAEDTTTVELQRVLGSSLMDPDERVTPSRWVAWISRGLFTIRTVSGTQPT